MAPSGPRTRAKKPKTTRKPRRTQVKKKLVKPKTSCSTHTQQEEPTSPNSPSSVVSDNLPKTETPGFEAIDDDDVYTTTSACSTPKGQRFRIPEIVTCPPAPKKQRVVQTCLFRRSPIAFFAPPDLELFFCFANGGISV